MDKDKVFSLGPNFHGVFYIWLFFGIASLIAGMALKELAIVVFGVSQILTPAFVKTLWEADLADGLAQVEAEEAEFEEQLAARQIAAYDEDSFGDEDCDCPECAADRTPLDKTMVICMEVTPTVH